MITIKKICDGWQFKKLLVLTLKYKWYIFICLKSFNSWLIVKNIELLEHCIYVFSIAYFRLEQLLKCLFDVRLRQFFRSIFREGGLGKYKIRDVYTSNVMFYTLSSLIFYLFLFTVSRLLLI